MKDATTNYYQALPAGVRTRLRSIRTEVLAILPEAEERISYDIPAFFVNGRGVIYAAAWKEHIALYPIPHGPASFDKAIAKYRRTKSAVHFPHDAPLPMALIRRIIRACARRAVAKSTRKA